MAFSNEAPTSLSPSDCLNASDKTFIAESASAALESVATGYGNETTARQAETVVDTRDEGATPILAPIAKGPCGRLPSRNVTAAPLVAAL